MKWRKLLLFLAISSAALGCFALRWPVFTIADHFLGFWPLVASIRFVHWHELLPPISTLDLATRWAICAALVIDLLYLVWLRRQRRAPTYPTADNALSAMHHYLSRYDYEELLYQRHAALLARYQDPALVQFLLNRETARAQQLDRWLEIHEPTEGVVKVVGSVKQKRNESAEQWPVDGTALPMVVNPMGA